MRGMLLALTTGELPLLRQKVASGIVPSNQELEEHMEEYRQAVNRRLHAASVLPA